ncbi:hypothetical protein H8F01_00920 [Dyella telluris]|uniref:Helix-turn-helix domain-containing protein n=2 Tax=Dyella telluris TaxID=2763498 RepID=A0A7G8QA16_9GAMM|nr:hypothetical protein H8F01_00920 [Dyella telluris]
MARTAPDMPLTTEEIAALLGLSEKWFINNRWQRKGPPFIQTGRIVRYELGATLDWFRKHRQKTIN